MQTNSDNNIEINTDMCAYNKETGILRIQNNAATLGNMSVSFKANGATLRTSSKPSTSYTVAQMSFMKDFDGDVVTFENLDGAGINNLLNGKYKDKSVNFYTNATAYTYTGTREDMGDYLGDTVYNSADIWEGYCRDDDGNITGSYWGIEPGVWETLKATSLVYKADDSWDKMYMTPKDLAVQYKYYMTIASNHHYPIDTANKDQMTQDLVDAGDGTNCSWEFTKTLSQMLSVKAWCTHISDDIRDYVHIDDDNPLVYSRVIAADAYHLTVSLVGGKTSVGGQTGSCIMKFKIAEYADVNVQKSSSNTNITDGNSCYSLSDAHYKLYENYNKTTNTVSGALDMDDLITDDKGVAARDRLLINAKNYINSKGDYVDSDGNDAYDTCTLYLKETEASKGFALDTGVYELNLSRVGANDGSRWHVSSVTYYKNGKAQAGTYLKDGVVQVKEDPQNDPINVLIKKNSANGKKIDGSTVEKESQGAATYKGAKFTVYYYDTTDATTLSKDHDTRVKAAKRTWVFQTDRDGAIDVSREGQIYEDDPDFRYYVSGDALYRDTAGDVTFPLGTYVIEETNAPAGFIAPGYNDRTFIEVIKPDENGSSEHVNNYHKEYYTPKGKTVGNIKYGTLDWNPWYLPGETKK